jgi:hypothetical protein
MVDQRVETWSNLSGCCGSWAMNISCRSPPLMPSFVTLVQQRQALSARHRRTILRGDPYHLLWRNDTVHLQRRLVKR